MLLGEPLQVSCVYSQGLFHHFITAIAMYVGTNQFSAMKVCLLTCGFYRGIILQKPMYCWRFEVSGLQQLSLPSTVQRGLEELFSFMHLLYGGSYISVKQRHWKLWCHQRLFERLMVLIIRNSFGEHLSTYISDGWIISATGSTRPCTALMPSAFIPWIGASHLQRLPWWSSYNGHLLQVDHVNSNEWVQ